MKKENSIWNTPNKISLARICLIPLVVFFYLATFIPYGKLVATIIFVVACLTDFVDGHLARKYNQVTDFGKFFDSIADKVLMATGLVLICAAPVSGSLPAPVIFPSYAGIICVVIMIAREFIISALRQIAAAKGLVLAADKGGKIKATVQYVAATGYMAFAFVLEEFVKTQDKIIDNKAVAAVRFVLLGLLVLATILTIYSGVSYIVRNRKVFTNDVKKEATPKTEAKAIQTQEGAVKAEEKDQAKASDDKVLEKKNTKSEK